MTNEFIQPISFKHNTVERKSAYRITVTGNRTYKSYFITANVGDADATLACACHSSRRGLGGPGECTHVTDARRFLREEQAEELAHQRPTAQEVVEDDYSDFDFGFPIFA